MGYDLYSGSSEGFEVLTDGYIDYAKEVIAHRSFPDLRDGLKPVGRRILYACHGIKAKGHSKCGTLVGRVMELHPHGDSSIYGALCAMTDINGSLNVPLFEGNGEFGRVHSSDTPAAMRYTKAKLNENAEEFFFKDISAVKFVLSEEGEGEEPEVLPARFPNVLVNGLQGMAVSVATELPSFNFHDVINLTIKGIEKGFANLSIEDDMIIPDLPTGGIIVNDTSELAKIMFVGKGKLKVRARVEVQGKDIIVKEVPYGRTAEGIVKAIQNSDIYGITNVRDTQGYNSSGLVTITCRSKKVVEDVLLELYRQRILQSTLNSNIMVTEEGVPDILGVYRVLERWVEWRKKVCKKKLQQNLDAIHDEIETLSYFIRLITNSEWRDTYVDRAVHKSKKEATEYLKSIFEDIPDDVCDWISGRSVSAFNNGGKYARRYDDLCEYKKTTQVYLSDISSYVIHDLKEVQESRKNQYQRKTEVTYQDYRFSVIKEEEKEDDSFCYYFLMKSGFLVKARDESFVKEEDVLCKIAARANSTLIGFDNIGRLLRVFGTDIPFTPMGSHGEFLPKYFDVIDNGSNSDAVAKYKILYLGLLDGKTRMLLYKDGFVGFLDTSEYVGKRKTKVVIDGVDSRVYDLLLDVIEEEDIPDCIMFADDHDDMTKFGLVYTATINRKSRRTRTKVLNGKNIQAKYYSLMGMMDVYKFTSTPEYYIGKMKTFKNIVGNTDSFVEGRYYVEGYLL